MILQPTVISTGIGAVSSIALSPNHSMLAAITVRAELLQVCRSAMSKPECAPSSGLTGWGYSVAFSEDGHWIGASSGIEGSAGTALLLNLDTNQKILLKGHTNIVSSIQFDKTGNRALTVSRDDTSRVWDVASGRELLRLITGKGLVYTSGFSPDGRYVVTESDLDSTLNVWEIPKVFNPAETVIDSVPKNELVSPLGNGQINFDPGGKLLAVPRLDGKISLLHIPEGTLRAVLEGDGSLIESMHFQPNGMELTAATYRGSLLVWSISPSLRLEDDLLPSVGRGLLPLAGSLAGEG